MVQLTGDEVSALVIEVGSYNTRAGYAGQDIPTAVLPSVVSSNGRVGDDVGLSIDCESGAEIIYPLKGGLIEDWDAFSLLVQHTLLNILRVNPVEHPLIMCEPNHSSKEQRERMFQFAFEVLKVPAFFLVKQAVLNTFAIGRSSALVVDVGAQVTTVTPVIDGYVIKKAIMQQNLAGDALDEQLYRFLKEEKKLPLYPHFRISRKKLVEPGALPDVTLKKLNNVSESFDHYARQKILRDFKETVCAVSETTFNEQQLQLRPQQSYEFPDGFHDQFGAERYRIPEALFNPKDCYSNSGSAFDFVGLSTLIANSLNACDGDIRNHLLNSIIITGGSTLFPSFAERLNMELQSRMNGIRVRLHASTSSMERKFGAWIGGSILGSLGTFQQVWVSKAEWEEHGPSILEKRCPA